MNPCYNTLRLYDKVYDKLAKNLDPTKSQCAEDEPNVLLLPFAGPGVSPNKPGVGWALDELFNTRDECSLTHANMTELERLLGDPPEYFV